LVIIFSGADYDLQYYMGSKEPLQKKSPEPCKQKKKSGQIYQYYLADLDLHQLQKDTKMF
jgi:hypothetical protein